jgi:hypothetical protein
MAIISKGRVLASGDPADALRKMQGKIWRRRVDKDDLEIVQREHAVISTKLVAGKTVVHVYSEEQPAGFESYPATLEDVYFSTLERSKAEAA